MTKAEKKVSILCCEVGVFWDGNENKILPSQIVKSFNFFEKRVKLTLFDKNKKEININEPLGVDDFLVFAEKISPRWAKVLTQLLKNMCYSTLEMNVPLTPVLTERWMDVIKSEVYSSDDHYILSTSLVPIFKTLAIANILPVPTPQAIGVMLSRSGFKSSMVNKVNRWYINIK